MNQKSSLAMVTIIILLFQITAFSTIPSSYAENESSDPNKKIPTKFAPDRLLVKFKPMVTKTQQKTIVNSENSEIAGEIPQIDVKIIKVPQHALEKVEKAFKNKTSVEYVERDYLLEPVLLPNDERLSSQWYIFKIQADKAWDVNKGYKNTRIAILDTGVETDHPDLKAKLTNGVNFYSGNYDSSDVCGHGTAVAGVAAAVTDNTIGVAGVAWSNDIIPIRISEGLPYCYGYYSAMARGLVYAADNGAQVANISFQIFNGDVLNDAVAYFLTKGVAVVAGSGNTATFENYAPNNFIISVGATDTNDKRAYFSSYGPYLDFTAPGTDILTTFKGGRYFIASGTSFSSPVVAGVIGLIKSQNAGLTSEQIYEILKATSVDLGAAGYDVEYGWGRIDAYKALQFASDTMPPSVFFTNLKNGTVINDVVTVSINATDNTKVTKVVLYVDDILYGQKNNAPYDFDFNTLTMSDGTHSLKAVAYDILYSNSKQISVTVRNDIFPPSISILSPTDGTIIKEGMTKISIFAADENGIKSVKLYIDGTLKATFFSEPYKYNWHIAKEEPGFHTITAEAVDGNENIANDTITIFKQKGEKMPIKELAKKFNLKDKDIKKQASQFVSVTKLLAEKKHQIIEGLQEDFLNKMKSSDGLEIKQLRKEFNLALKEKIEQFREWDNQLNNVLYEYRYDLQQSINKSTDPFEISKRNSLQEVEKTNMNVQNIQKKIQAELLNVQKVSISSEQHDLNEELDKIQRSIYDEESKFDRASNKKLYVLKQEELKLQKQLIRLDFDLKETGFYEKNDVKGLKELKKELEVHEEQIKEKENQINSDYQTNDKSADNSGGSDKSDKSSNSGGSDKSDKSSNSGGSDKSDKSSNSDSKKNG